MKFTYLALICMSLKHVAKIKIEISGSITSVVWGIRDIDRKSEYLKRAFMVQGLNDKSYYGYGFC